MSILYSDFKKFVVTSISSIERNIRITAYFIINTFFIFSISLKITDYHTQNLLYTAAKNHRPWPGS
uniref:Uncharacterized protein n=1 Tax=Rhizophagus irregularis (strain DAOM 181602 / DAOM 197198 / MUCL 43194) TaxID=747089 RepID=U9UPU8_RHIID